MTSVSVTMTINGKPYSEANLKNEIERMMMEAVISDVKEKISSAITPHEAQQITIDVQGHDLGRLSLSVSGPDEIVAKVRAVLG